MWTIIGTITAIIGLLYAIYRGKKSDDEKHQKKGTYRFKLTKHKCLHLKTCFHA